MDEQYVGETTSSSSVGLTLGGILSIKQTPPYRIHARTLLDLIRDDQSYGKQSKKPWKMFRDKLRLKLYGSVSTTTVPVIASHAHVSQEPHANFSPNPHAHVSTDPHAHVSTDYQEHVSTLTHAQVSTDTHAYVSTDHQAHVSSDDGRILEVDRGGGGDRGGQVAVRMSLMSLLEVEASAYVNDNGGEEEEEEEEVVTVEEGGGYNNCCVCMVRHKGAAFIPCGHTFCRLCSRELFVKRASCPLCNNLILEILDIF